MKLLASAMTSARGLLRLSAMTASSSAVSAGAAAAHSCIRHVGVAPRAGGPRPFSSTRPGLMRQAQGRAPAAPVTSPIQEALQRGAAAWEAGDVQGALDAYTLGMLAAGGDATTQVARTELHFNIGNCLYAQGKIDAAMEAWARCVEGQQDQKVLGDGQQDADLHLRTNILASVHVNMANVYALHRRAYPEAFKHYRAALALVPQDGEVAFNYAAVLDAAGGRENLLEAIVQYDVARKHGVAVAERHLRNALVRAAASAEAPAATSTSDEGSSSGEGAGGKPSSA